MFFKKINLNSSIEQNNFTLVRDYLNGDIVEKKDGISHYALSDEFIIVSDELKNRMREVENIEKPTKIL